MSAWVIGHLRCELGESPVWDAAASRLRLVDIARRKIHFVDPTSGDVESLGVTEAVTAIVPWRTNIWLAVFERSVGSIDLRTGEVTALITIPGPPELALNDAVCGRDGRLYVGSVDRDQLCRGELYAIDANFSVSTVLENIGASNGVDTSPDGTILYHADTFAGTVSRSPAGPPIAVPHPDGLTVDSEGCVWVALWGSGEVRRYDAAGALDRSLQIPVPNVTSVAFGGAHLDTLFVTTARSEETGLSGRLFQYRPGVAGLAPARFDGEP
jgi:sugar lactone lactonase YvrE